ncbi:PAAR domain-containing protein [Pseudomonas sp.]|uniref:PAAR domain-containing protein n=1 Tax=Pseudomonas sp. TaxID=306 RepID=UPI0028A8DBAD|nr:PAAR domain-containing protein [Pseudomonas sp.]
MAIGYFIREGDKTTCGGVVLEGSSAFRMSGARQAREGDRVTCGKDRKVYRIIGGIAPMRTDRARLAGSEDSISGCPCRAALLPSLFSATYQTGRGGTQTAASSTSPGTLVTAPLPTASGQASPLPVMDSPLEEEEEEEEVQQEAGIVLRLGLFFDGTGNNLANSTATEGCHALNLGMEQTVAEEVLKYCAAYGFDGQGKTPDNSYGNAVSNIARLHDLYPDQSEEQLPPEADEAYIKVYVEGIGTRSGLADSVYSQGTGRGSTGVVARVEQIPAQTMEKLRRFASENPRVKVRRIEVDLFGFSRGAAAARHCANDLLKGPDSLLARALPAGSPLLTAAFTWRHRSDFALNFIGLFDTVAGIVSPADGDFSPHNADNPGLNLRLAPDMARQVIHLTARDEYRHNFSLTQAELDIELPGCHSDIGGGYLPLMREKLLLTKPDSSVEIDMLANERSAAFSRTRQRYHREIQHWLDHIPQSGLGITTWSVPLQQRRRDTVADKRVYVAITGEREVRGELSLVYLRIMRELAVRAGVAFNDIPATQAFALPDELLPIAAKLQAFALREAYTPLTFNENALLRRRYIHLSANWNAAKGWNNSALDVLFINRPAEGMVRQEHPNE